MRLVATLLQWERRWRWHAAKRGALVALVVAGGLGLLGALALRIAPATWALRGSLFPLMALLAVAAVGGALVSARRPAVLHLAAALDRARGAVDDAILAAAALGNAAGIGNEPALGEAICERALEGLETVEARRVFPRLGRLGALAAVLSAGAVLTVPRTLGEKVDGFPGDMLPGGKANVGALPGAKANGVTLNVDESREIQARLQELVTRSERVHDDRARTLARSVLQEWAGNKSTGSPSVATEGENGLENVGERARHQALEKLAQTAVAAANASAAAERALAGAADALAGGPRGPGLEATSSKTMTNSAPTGEGRGDLLRQALERLQRAAEESAAAPGTRSAGTAGLLANALNEAAAALTREAGSGSANTAEGSDERNSDVRSAPRGTETAGKRDEGTPPSEARVLERLRRDLGDAARACASDPAACQRSLARAARTERDLAREKGDAVLRRSLADLASSLARGGLGPRRGHGAREGHEEGHEGQRAQGSPAPAPRNSTEGPSREGTAASDREAAELSREGNSEPAAAAHAATAETAPAKAAPASATTSAGRSADESRAASPSTRPSLERGGISTSSGDLASEGISLAGGGRGQKAGAPLSPSPDDGPRDHHAGSLSPEDIQRITGSDTGVGPSRSTTIAGAATAGPVTPAYRRVFGEYAEVAEHALSDTHVNPSHRALVERYFDAIRPR